MMASIAQFRKMNKAENIQNLSTRLLDWYDNYARELPWRTGPADVARGQRSDPYGVWLSEIMLQQTTVGAVKDYYMKFLRLWPNVKALANADEEEVLKAWAGLGYYSRARNLHKAARQVVDMYGGLFPPTFDDLIKLTGVGRYTAAAIAAIAFDQPAPVVDGNVERVFSRLFAIETPFPTAKSEVYTRVEAELERGRPGDFAQACMDLGATVCTPRNPKCDLCPLVKNCAGYTSGSPQRFPVKLAKPLKPLRFGAAYVAKDSSGAVLLTKREDKGLLAGMTGVPTTKWDSRQDGATDLSEAPIAGDWQECGSIRHVFTHFELSLKVYRLEVGGDWDSEYKSNSNRHWWSNPSDLPDEALPSVMKKAIEAAVAGATKKRG
jgi:A/G-specific adenine glycosylase